MDPWSYRCAMTRVALDGVDERASVVFDLEARHRGATARTRVLVASHHIQSRGSQREQGVGGRREGHRIHD
jgi:hypothetical protein